MAVFRKAVDRQHLSAYLRAHRRAEIEAHIRDVARVDECVQRRLTQIALAHLVRRLSELRRLARYDALDARPLDAAGAYRVGADFEFAEFERDGLREPDDGPLRRGVGRPEWIGEEARCGAEVYDRTAARLYHHRRGELRAEKLTVEIRLDGVRPLVYADLVDARRRPRDAGVVYEEVEAAHLSLNVAEDALHVVPARRVGDGVGQPRHLRGALLKLLKRAAAYMHARAGLVERRRYRLSDPVGTGGHKNPFAFYGKFHIKPLAASVRAADVLLS